MKRILALIYLTICLTCQGAPPAEKANPAATPATGARLSDAEIEKDIKARFARSKLASGNFQVKVQAGVATLDGTASVVQHKGIATRMARSAGARTVVNRIRVSEAARQKAADQLAGARKATVKRQQ